MQKRLFVFALALVTITAFAAAQTSMAKVTVDVPFTFIVSGKTLPAGTYKFAANGNMTQISVTGADNKGSALAMVTTRLSKRSETEASVVFDVAGRRENLGELLLGGRRNFAVAAEQNRSARRGALIQSKHIFGHHSFSSHCL